MARRSDHSRDELRDLALDAAESIVERDGVEALTARRIAGEIGYTAGSLYLVFTNLDDLFVQLNARTLARLGRELDASAERDAAPTGRIVALGRAYLRYAARHPARWALLFRRRDQEMDNLPESYRGQVRALFERVEIQLRRLDGRQSEEDVRLAARALWSGVHGICTLAATESLEVAGSDHVEKLAETLIACFLAGWARPLEPLV
ncbi:TetR/AcrR family transcriptional regulator [Methylococcus sp. EFPC2]|uniref:TetR/AcrR family transcriptional regulator n=1 Tax=Methylococcus sp. EFPC2 TaxID=2812648 RepID=UPI001968708F|nr:WHG domain-containing protein [Methylococcus sp. EFPC2]QSA98213.1 WHG domain-containing protein [Methylococcus sp. EFPC2]